MVPTSYFSFQPVLHDWHNKVRDMYSPVYGMGHIKYPLLLIGKCNPYNGDSRDSYNEVLSHIVLYKFI